MQKYLKQDYKDSRQQKKDQFLKLNKNFNNLIKYAVIQGDRKTQEILEIYQKNANKQELEKGILELLDQSDESLSVYSIPSQYKSRRPKPVQVKSLEKNWYSFYKNDFIKCVI